MPCMVWPFYHLHLSLKTTAALTDPGQLHPCRVWQVLALSPLVPFCYEDVNVVAQLLYGRVFIQLRLNEDSDCFPARALSVSFNASRSVAYHWCGVSRPTRDGSSEPFRNIALGGGG